MKCAFFSGVIATTSSSFTAIRWWWDLSVALGGVVVVPLFQLDSIRLELMEVLVLWTEELSDVSWTEEVSELTDVSTLHSGSYLNLAGFFRKKKI